MSTAAEWHQRAGSLRRSWAPIIDGRPYSGAGLTQAPLINPATGQPVAEIGEGDGRVIDQAARAARAAFEDGRWADLKPAQRKRILLKLAELMRTHKEELALLETLSMGKPISDSLSIDVRAASDCIQYYAEACDKVYGEVGPTGPDDLSLIVKEPVGVVGLVVPWNFPLLMACWKLGPALAVGNSVVLKPAEQSPLTALRLAELALEAGLPEGVLNVVPGRGEIAGKALGLHMEVDTIGFTGSTEVGKLFLSYSAQSNMKRVWLECGGKTPNIITADCPDLEAAIEATAAGVFFNQGEMCTSASRLLVDKKLAAEVIERLSAARQHWQPGDPLDPASRNGALVSDQHMGRVLGYIGSAKSQGANIIGGQRVKKDSGGYFVEPTILHGVAPSMTVAKEEIFGPVLSVIAYDTLDEAVKIANDSFYGLASAIWTRDLSTAHRVARKIKAGLVYVNCFDADDITTPFGGYRQSGIGRDKSLHALDKYSETKTIWIRL